MKEPELILLNDFSHSSIRALFTARSVAEYNNVHWKEVYFYILLNMLQSIIKKFNIKPEEMICCLDSRNNWRKEIDSEYKAQRNVNRNNDDFDWYEYFEAMDELIEALNKGTKIRFLKIDKTEADDVIAISAKYFVEKYNFTKVVILSSDKDLKQLINSRVSMYDPIKDITYKLKGSKLSHNVQR